MCETTECVKLIIGKNIYLWYKFSVNMFVFLFFFCTLQSFCLDGIRTAPWRQNITSDKWSVSRQVVRKHYTAFLPMCTDLTIKKDVLRCMNSFILSSAVISRHSRCQQLDTMEISWKCDCVLTNKYFKMIKRSLKIPVCGCTRPGSITSS